MSQGAVTCNIMWRSFGNIIWRAPGFDAIGCVGPRPAKDAGMHPKASPANLTGWLSVGGRPASAWWEKRPGVHFCHFFDTKQDLLDILIPYFQAGLNANELCVWVIFDPLSRQDAVEALRSEMPAIDERLEAGDILIVSHAEWYLAEGTLDVSLVMKRWHDIHRQALENGYSGLRVNGNEAWLRAEDWEKFADYEAKLSQFIRDKQMLVLCTYPLHRTGASELFDVASTHDFVIARRLAKWEVLKTAELRHANAEIAVHQRIEAQLRHEQEILQRIFDNVPAMINFIDQNGELRVVNQEWERTLGWTLEEVRERGIDIFAELYPDPEERRRVRHFVANPGGNWQDFRMRVRSGQTIDTSWAEVRLSDGTIIGIGQDITARKQAEASVRATSEQLRALTARLQSAREEEAARIAREIHDELGSALTTLRWDLESLVPLTSQEFASPPAERMHEKIGGMIAVVDTTIQTIRRIASELRPRILDDLGLPAAIEWQAQQFQARTGIVCTLKFSADTVSLTRDQSTAVFRILQEALTNVLRHAQATRVQITMRQQREQFVLTIRDNGRGITAQEQHGIHSIGIVGMQERAHLAGGVLEIGRAEDDGTVVTVRIPAQG